MRFLHNIPICSEPSHVDVLCGNYFILDITPNIMFAFGIQGKANIQKKSLIGSYSK